MKDRPMRWAIQQISGGPRTLYRTREQARNAAKHRSRFDDCAYAVLRLVSIYSTPSKVPHDQWSHVETYDFHKHMRKAMR